MRALLVAFVLSALGCRVPTSTLVVIDAPGHRVPDALQGLTLTVTNPTLGGPPVFESPTLRRCAAGQLDGCVALPLSVTLRPGADHPEAPVRVEVETRDAADQRLTHDAAQFTFTDGLAQQVNFFLSEACLQSDCAARDRQCGPNGGCVVGGVAPDLGADPLAPPITPVAHFSGTTKTQTYSVPPAMGLAAGDLVVLSVAADPPFPAGWTQLATFAGPRVVLARRADVDEAANTAAYTFSVSNGFDPWLMEVLRGVGGFRVDAAFETPSLAAGDRYDVPSVDARAGDWLLTVAPSSYGLDCEIDGARMTFISNKSGALDEEGPLLAGPTGPRPIVCTSNTDGLVRLTLAQLGGLP